MENKDNGKLFIKLHKAYCHQMEDKINEGKTFNRMTMPKGVVIGDKDYSGWVINPKLMYESHYNPNEMVAQYDTEHLTDNQISIKNIKESTAEKVDINELKAAIDTQKENYRAMKKEQQAQTENQQSKDKDKGEEL